ncbi:MAG TPA: hypothetical protein VGJ86_22055 [Acidimicrobiales bacterium]
MKREKWALWEDEAAIPRDQQLEFVRQAVQELDSAAGDMGPAAAKAAQDALALGGPEAQRLERRCRRQAAVRREPRCHAVGRRGRAAGGPGHDPGVAYRTTCGLAVHDLVADRGDRREHWDSL